jgi:hypothetical protein
VTTLVLQRQRRRKHADVSLRFWRTGMVVLLVVAFLTVADLFVPDPMIQDRLEVLMGVLLIVGVFMPLINGMLYKIVPFLNWLHLQRLISPVPNMKHMLGDKAMASQFRVHMAALVCLALAVFLPLLTVPGGLLLAASGSWLEWNLASAVLLYRRLARGQGAQSVTMAVQAVSR